MANWCTKQLVNRKVIAQKQYNIYVYGFQLLYSTIISITTMLLIALFTGYLLEGLIYLFIFISLRMTANGYHAKTYFRCFLLSNTMFTVYLFLISAMRTWHVQFVLVTVAIFSSVYIWFNAPVIHPNHKLSDKRKQVNRFRARCLLIIIWNLQIILYIFSIKNLNVASNVVLILVAIMMIIRNKKPANKKSSIN